jgi:hypothetical protein
MDRGSLAAVKRLGMAGVLCAAALIGSACGRDAAMRASSVIGPSAVAAEGGTGSGAAPGGMTAEALSGGLTPIELIERGWSCRVTPDGETACSPPGRGLPVFGAPEDRPPSYLVHLFDTATSGYLGFTRMIRTDLYEGQTCASTGVSYVDLPHIGYYSCFHPVG